MIFFFVRQSAGMGKKKKEGKADGGDEGVERGMEDSPKKLSGGGGCGGG